MTMARRPSPGSDPIQTAGSESEIRFLEYRLEVVGSWPDSERKQALIDAISRRLRALRVAA
jgi:hypothetical protein